MSYSDNVLRNPSGGGTWLSGNLTGTYAATNYPPGVTAYTSDLGIVVNTGSAWTQVGGGGSSIPTSYSATVASSVNNYAPSGFGPNTVGKLTPASGGSTITGFSSTGWTANQSGALLNQSTTDSFTFPHQSASSSAGNQFNNANGATATLAPGAGCRVLWDGSYFRFH